MTLADPAVHAERLMEYRAPPLHVAGHWRDGRGAGRHAVKDPATGAVIGELSMASTGDIDEAIAAAEKGFAAWSAVPAWKRADALGHAAGQLAHRTEEIARLLTWEQGKPLAEARQEIASTVQVIRWYAEEGRRTYGRIIPPRRAGSEMRVVREPVGPCAAFSPWNFPLMLSSRKISGALATGCSVVLKAAEETPAAVAAMVECFLSADLPAGALQLLYGSPAEISQRLLASAAIRKVSFTGSVPVGRLLARLAADQLQRVTLELGGHAPVLIFADADLDVAIPELLSAKFRNAGQACIAPTRFLVERSIYDDVVERLGAGAARLRMGPGMSPTTQMGPLAIARRQHALQPLVADAVERGARVVTGGAAPAGDGFFFRPTVLADVPAAAQAMQSEPFGPLALVSPFDMEKEALAIANATPMGLAAYLYTDSASRQQRLAEGIRAGMVAVNVASVSAPEAPFGGVGDSGYGSECGIEGLDGYLQTKFIHVQSVAVSN